MSASAYGRARTVTYEAGAEVSEHDVVAIADGQVVPADDTDNPDDVGIATGNAEAGETVTIALAGVVPANVDGAVTAGDELDVSATAGQLAAGAGDYTAITDAGDTAGLSHGGKLEANEALVNF